MEVAYHFMKRTPMCVFASKDTREKTAKQASLITFLREITFRSLTTFQGNALDRNHGNNFGKCPNTVFSWAIPTIFNWPLSRLSVLGLLWNLQLLDLD